MPKSTKGVPGLISLEWWKCPDGYTVETLLRTEFIRYEIEECDDGTDRWKLMAYPADNAPAWLRDKLSDDPQNVPWANGAMFFRGEAKARREAIIMTRLPIFQDGDQIIVPRSTRTISHRIIEDSPGAFMEIADCVESPDNTARFVSLYGYPYKLEDLTEIVGMPHTETLDFTLFEELAVQMRDAIDMWERAKKTGDYRKLKIVFERATFLDAEDFAAIRLLGHSMKGAGGVMDSI